MPVSCSPTRSMELSRGASPEPKHRPTSGIVILELRRRRRVREGGQSTRQSLSGAAPSSSGRSCGSTNARIAGAQALSSQRGSSSVPLAALVCVQPLSAFGARVQHARNDFQRTVLPLLLTTGAWAAVPLTGRDGIAGVPIEIGEAPPWRPRAERRAEGVSPTHPCLARRLLVCAAPGAECAIRSST